MEHWFAMGCYCDQITIANPGDRPDSCGYQKYVITRKPSSRGT